MWAVQKQVVGRLLAHRPWFANPSPRTSPKLEIKLLLQDKIGNLTFTEWYNRS